MSGSFFMTVKVVDKIFNFYIQSLYICTVFGSRYSGLKGKSGVIPALSP